MVKEVKKLKKNGNKKSNNIKVVQNSNSYSKSVLVIVVVIAILLGTYFYYQYKHGSNSTVITADEKKFKSDYESLNGTDALDIEIIENNNVKYIEMEEAANILREGSGVIYFGFAKCPWCRNAVPSLLAALDSSNLDTLYYVNIRPDGSADSDIRDKYVLNEKNVAKLEKEGITGYKEVLKLLDKYLSDYELTTNKGKKVKVGEKRLYVPAVVTVRDGKVYGYHEGTLEGHEIVDGKLPELSNSEKDKLYEIYSQMISDYLNDSCPIDNSGC